MNVCDREITCFKPVDSIFISKVNIIDIRLVTNNVTALISAVFLQFNISSQISVQDVVPIDVLPFKM